MPQRKLRRRYFDEAEYDGQMQSPWADRTRIEHSKAAILADERNVRMAANDQSRTPTCRTSCRISTDLRAVNSDVSQQQLEHALASRLQIDGDCVWKMWRALINVAANGDHRRDLRQPIKHV